MENGGLLAHKFNLTLNQRKTFFYGICIWVRTLIALLAFRYRSKKWFLPLVATITGIVVYFDLTKKARDKEVWWSRTFHYYLALLIFLAALYQLIFGLHKIPIIAQLLLLDVIYGVITSFFYFK